MYTFLTSIFQLWTAEEQLRLEELLVEFPPETNENSRWRKIAKALGKYLNGRA